MEEDPKILVSDKELEFLSKWTSKSNIESLRAHVLSLWRICKEKYHTYVCIERFAFLNPRMPNHFAYPTLLAKMKPSDPSNSPKLIDVGCCFGQDVRQGISTKLIVFMCL